MRQTLRVAGDDDSIQTAVGGDHRRIGRQQCRVHGATDQRLYRPVGTANHNRLNVESLLGKESLLYPRPKRTVSGGFGGSGHRKCHLLLRE